MQDTPTSCTRAARMAFGFGFADLAHELMVRAGKLEQLDPHSIAKPQTCECDEPMSFDDSCSKCGKELAA